MTHCEAHGVERDVCRCGKPDGEPLPAGGPPTADELLEELRARRSCIEGARQTVEMVGETLRNADDLDLVRRSLEGAVAERLDLLDDALAKTDAMIGRAT